MKNNEIWNFVINFCITRSKAISSLQNNKKIQYAKTDIL